MSTRTRHRCSPVSGAADTPRGVRPCPTPPHPPAPTRTTPHPRRAATAAPPPPNPRPPTPHPPQAATAARRNPDRPRIIWTPSTRRPSLDGMRRRRTPKVTLREEQLALTAHLEFSVRLNEAQVHQDRIDRLGELSDWLQEEHGAVTDEELAEARRTRESAHARINAISAPSPHAGRQGPAAYEPPDQSR